MSGIRSHRYGLSKLLGSFALISLLSTVTGDEAVAQRIFGGNIILSIVDPGDARMAIAPVINTTCTFRYAGGNRTRKVTVSSVVTNPHYALFIRATNVSIGNPQDPIDLVANPGPTDFIRDIPRWSPASTCTLEYQAVVRYEDGYSGENGGDTAVRVTFTYVNQ